VSRSLRIAQHPESDAMLASDPFALLVGMLLDQQVKMEVAFLGPYVLSQRLGDSAGRLDPYVVAGCDAEAFVEVMRRPPSVHRYPGAMAGRVQALARVVVDEYGGDAARIWSDVPSGVELLARLRGLPGFGEQKAKIFVALLAKQFEVAPPGWREASEPYGEPGSYRSVADVVDEMSLAKVREFKREAKQAAKGGG
jgi:uncharacterized HhH-GPD family protein